MFASDQNPAVHDDPGLEAIEMWLREESCDVDVGGAAIQLVWRSNLAHDALEDDDDPIGHRHRFTLVMGHEDRCGSQSPLQGCELCASLMAQGCVKIGKRLIEQEHVWLANQRPTERDPLTLSAGELRRLAAQPRLDLKKRRNRVDTIIDRSPFSANRRHKTVCKWQPLPSPQFSHKKRSGEVVVAGKMRIQSVILKHKGDAAISGPN